MVESTTTERLAFGVPGTIWTDAADFAVAVGRLVDLGARHVMLVGLDLTGLDASGLGTSGVDHAVEDVLELPDGSLARVATRMPIDDPRYPSLTPILPAAAWDEREVRAGETATIVPPKRRLSARVSPRSRKCSHHPE